MSPRRSAWRTRQGRDGPRPKRFGCAGTCCWRWAIAAAEASYCEAIAIAQEQCAKLWELRAAMSLARLWRDRGKRTEARDLLAPIYGWFTEGFGTPVLKDAKALLEQLAP